jgi:hypothetical protein
MALARGDGGGETEPAAAEAWTESSPPPSGVPVRPLRCPKEGGRKTGGVLSWRLRLHALQLELAHGDAEYVGDA